MQRTKGVNRFFLLLMIFMLALATMTACEHSEATDPNDDDPPPTTESTLSSIQAAIFDVRCATAGCHISATSPHNLNLSDGSSFSNLVNVTASTNMTETRVIPGDADNSFLIKKLEGTSLPPMPLTGDLLTTEQIDTIKEWINDGALDN